MSAVPGISVCSGLVERRRGQRRCAPDRSRDGGSRAGADRRVGTPGGGTGWAAEGQPSRARQHGSPTLIEDRKRLEKQVSELQRKLATGSGAPELEEIAGIPMAARNVGEVPGKELRSLIDAIAEQVGSGVVALVSTADGKASIAVGVSQDLVKRVSAVDLVRAAAAAVGGKGGGGRPDMAQAGGPDGERADEALEAIRGVLRTL